MKLTRYEQETIINFNASDDMASLYSADPVWMRKIEKLGGTKLGIGMEVNVPKSWVRIQKPNKLSPEAKKAAAERLKKLRLDNSTS